jgi:hypothetical protein
MACPAEQDSYRILPQKEAQQTQAYCNFVNALIAAVVT